MAFISKGYERAISYADLGILLTTSGAAYTIFGATSFQVTGGPGPRQISVAAGRAAGKGIYDVSDSTVTVDATPGTRWDTVVLRRDWAAEKTEIVVLQGTAAKAITKDPAAIGVGILDDQPLALVRWASGQTAAQEIEDLRVWARAGGAFATSELVRGYLNDIGTRVRIVDQQWERVIIGGNVTWYNFSAALTDEAGTFGITRTTAGAPRLYASKALVFDQTQTSTSPGPGSSRLMVVTDSGTFCSFTGRLPDSYLPEVLSPPKGIDSPESIATKKNVTADGNVAAGGNVTAAKSIAAQENVTASKQVVGGDLVRSQKDVKADRDVLADGDVRAQGAVTGEGAARFKGVYSTDITSGSARPVVVGEQGTLGYKPSTRAKKQNIRPADLARDVLTRIPVVTYRYRNEVARERRDPDYRAAYEIGTLAEDLHDLGLRNFVVYQDGKPASVHYDLLGLAGIALAQILAGELDAQGARLDALEQRLAVLEA